MVNEKNGFSSPLYSSLSSSLNIKMHHTCLGSAGCTATEKISEPTSDTVDQLLPLSSERTRFDLPKPSSHIKIVLR